MVNRLIEVLNHLLRTQYSTCTWEFELVQTYCAYTRWPLSPRKQSDYPCMTHNHPVAPDPLPVPSPSQSDREFTFERNKSLIKM